MDMFSSVKRQEAELRETARPESNRGTHELDETIEAEGGVRAGRVYLPASFMGSPRMQTGCLKTTRQTDVLHHGHLKSQLAKDSKQSRIALPKCK